MFDTEEKRRQPPSKGLRYYLPTTELEVRQEEGEGAGPVTFGGPMLFTENS